jgi:ketosteroid isomerase-like protein
VNFLISLLITLFVPGQASTPQNVADELLAADRAFAAASEKTGLVSGLSAMFAPDVAMPAPGGYAFGSQKAIDALKANPANNGAKAVWTPARVGISSDGMHGFTAGFMTITRADGSVAPAKYLAYWEKQSAGWRALVYKRVPAKTVPADVKVTYLLPARVAASKRDAAAIERDRDSLSTAEQSFAAEAQQIGLGPAFRKYGSPDAINLGGPNTPAFAWGNDEIATLVGQNEPPTGSSVNWGPEKAIVAASGDFGVTLGYITPNKARPNTSTSSAQDEKTPPPQPFFTIWRKDAGGAWKYVAE